MAPSMSLYVVGFLVLAALLRNFTQGGGDDTVMQEGELLGLFEVLGALLEDPENDWAQFHPLPCTDTPWPGVQCEVGEEEDPPVFHVTKIHIGPDVTTPPCKTSATLSSSLHKLPYLKTLSIFNCFVSSPVNLSPALLGGLSSLEHLSLNSNPTLFGEIPSSLAQISSLRVLSFSQNSLHGNIPGELGGLVNLEQLDLSYNNLSGGIPEEIGGLKSLTILDLSSNRLGGEIPFSLGQLQLLEKIDLGCNQFVGRVPPELGKLNRLVLLDLSHNLITGPLSLALSGLEHLQYLTVDHNPLNSGVPLFVPSLKRLISMSFSGCGFTGPIPNYFSSLENLSAISLDNNSLTGPVPSSLGSLPNLDQLNVSHNKLSGELSLPQEFISRLGNRLDVRGNSGLCTSNKMYNEKNVSVTLETPICLGTVGSSNNRTCHHEDKNCPQENPDQPRGKESSLYHWNIRSCATTPCPIIFFLLLGHLCFFFFFELASILFL